jgi:cysteine-rich repeat protein
MKTIRFACLLGVLACVTPVSAIDVVWDGGGADNNWDTPANWTGDAVPTFFDNAIFDGTSTKDCVITLNQEVFDFTMTAAYTGTLSRTAGNVTINGAMLVQGGTITGMGALLVEGAVTIEGGTVNLANQYSTYNGSFAVQGGGVSGLRGIFNGNVILGGGTVSWYNTSTYNATFTVQGSTISALRGTFNGDFVVTAGTVSWSNSASFNSFLGAVLIQGGAMNWSHPRYDFRGDYIRTGGTVTTTTLTYFRFLANAPQAFTVGAGGISLRLLQVAGGSLQELSITGDVTINNSSGNMSFSSSSTTNLDGTLTLIPGNVFNVSGAATTLNVLDGSIVDANAATTYTNTGLINEIGTGKVLRGVSGVGFTDAVGTPLGIVAVGGDVFITLFDDDENLDGAALDTLVVTVQSLTTGDSETITLTETGNATAEFRNTVGLPTAAGVATVEDGTLQQDGSEDLLVSYTDDEDATDTTSANLQAPPVVWDGGGTDNNWDTPENWSGDQVPSAFDSVTFDGTSTKDCVITLNQEVFDFTMTAAYTGTLSRTAGNITINGAMLVQGGTITGMGALLVEGTVTIEGGSVNLANQYSTYNGSFAVQGGAVSGLRGIFNSDVILGGGTVSWFNASTYNGTFTVQGSTISALRGTFNGDFVVTAGTVSWSNSASVNNFYGAVLIQGGTVNWGSPRCEMRGDYIRTGGTVTTTTSTYFRFLANAPQAFTTGAGGISLRILAVQGGSLQELNITGDVTINNSSGNATFFSSSTTNLDGTLTLISGNIFNVSGAATILNVLDGSIVDANAATTYTNTGLINEIGTGKVLRGASGAGFTDAVGAPVVTVSAGGDIFITLFDDDENLDGTALDTLDVTVQSLTTGDSETVTLTETGNSTAEFRNTVGLPTAAGVATTEDGTLQQDGSEDLLVNYTDGEDATDSTSANLQAPPAVWDGGGTDNNWDTPGNWSGDQVPSAFNSVIFNGTSTKDCVITLNQEMFDFTMTAAYTGTLSRTAGNVTINGAMLVQGGTITGMGALLVEGAVTIEGGTVNLANQYSTYNGSFAVQGGGVSGLRGIFNGNVILGGGTVSWYNTSTYNATFTVQGSTISALRGTFNGDFVVTAGTVSWSNSASFNSFLGAVLIQGGAMNWSHPRYDFRGDYIRTGGTVTTTTLTYFRFLANAPQAFTVGAGGISLRLLQVAGGSLQELSITGDVTINNSSGNMSFSSSSTTNLDGTLTLIPGNVFNVSGAATTLNVLDGSIVDANAATTYTNTGLINEIGTGKVLRRASGLGMTDSGGTIPVDKIDLGDPIYVLLFDEDENVDGTVPDTTQVTLTNTVNGDVETVTLTETGNATEDFFIGAGFPTAIGAATSGNGTLEGSVGNVIEIRYADDEDPSDVLAVFKATTIPDCNANSVDDLTDIALGTSLDCDLNSVPDECQIPPIGNTPDCNSDGIPDLCQIDNNDCNINGVPDDCESFPDCNSNSVTDACDIFDGTSADCNLNGIPDECETADCDNDGIPDSCEPDCDNDGTPDDCEMDCNANSIPDDCEVFTDCNTNSVPDECDIDVTDPDGNTLVSADVNNNGIPDECEGPICGDGIVEGAETCDDGNTTSGDGCDANCQAEFCGDGIVNDAPNEACDDGDTIDNGEGGCLADCSGIQTCGDGFTEGTEGCDDGDTIDNGEGGCLADCSSIQTCGDGFTTGTEICDDGDTIDNGEGGCFADCSGIQTCGDGFTEGTEACDDGDTIDNGEGSCLADCSGIQICGDGFTTGTESCDDGDTIDNGEGGCLADCSGTQTCGDGFTEGTEVCDDGDTIDNGEGGCLADCSGIQTCGDGSTEGTEACDDGGESATCDVDCTLAVCGDDYMNAAANEECDGTDNTACSGLCREDCICVVPAPMAEPGGASKQRFSSFVVPTDGAGRDTALRVTLISLYDPSAPFPLNPPDFSAREGEVRYVNLLRDGNGDPVTSCLSSAAFLTFYQCATLGCNPEYADWAGLFGGEPIHLSGSAIVPDSVYTISQLAASCAGNEAACVAASEELQLATARYGDADSNDLANVTDVVLTVDVVKSVLGAAWEYQCYIRKQDPEPHLDATNVTDIVLHVDAVKLFAYQFTVPGCP